MTGINPTPLSSLTQPPQPVKKSNEDVEIMRDTAWRYGGFADEAGEMLKPYLGQAGRVAGYGISGIYCLTDLFLTAKKMNERGKHLPDKERRKKVAAELFDLSVFHTFATMLIPPMIIGKAVSWTQKHLSPDHPEHFKKTLAFFQQGAGRWVKTQDAEQMIRKRLHKPIPALVGLAMIPIVAHPFDLFMEKVQDWTTRILLGKHRLVKQKGPMIVQPQDNGKSKVTQLPDHWQSVPNKDYWVSKSGREKLMPGFEAPTHHTSTHKHKNRPSISSKDLHQPHQFESMFGVW